MSLKQTLSLALIGTIAASAQGQISLGSVDPLINFGNTGAATVDVNLTLQEGSNSVLLVGVGWEFGAAPTSFFDPTGANAPLTQLLFTESNTGNASRLAIFAYDLGNVGPANTSVDINFTNGTTGKQNLLTAVQLFGVDVGTNFDNVLTSTDGLVGTSVTNSISGAAAGSFAFSIANNRNPAALTADTGYTISGEAKPSNANNRTGYGYQTGVSGDLEYTWTSTANDGMTLGTVVLAPVPEPSAYALIAGIVGFACVMLRRRA